MPITFLIDISDCRIIIRPIKLLVFNRLSAPPKIAAICHAGQVFEAKVLFDTSWIGIFRSMDDGGTEANLTAATNRRVRFEATLIEPRFTCRFVNTTQPE